MNIEEEDKQHEKHHIRQVSGTQRCKFCSKSFFPERLLSHQRGCRVTSKTLGGIQPIVEAMRSTRLPRESRYESNNQNMFNYEEDLGVPSVISMDDPIDIE